MSQPKVTQNEADGQLGTLPVGQKILAICGPASAGPIATPATYGRDQDVVTVFTSGAMVEAGAHHIRTKGLPALVCRSTASVASTFDTIDVTGKTGTTTATNTGGSLSDYEYEAVFLCVTGGTLGIAGITYQTSLDGGRTYGPVTALGTALVVVVPNSGSPGVGWTFTTATTLVAGDIVRTRYHAPASSATDYNTAIVALQNSAVDWDVLLVVGPITPTIQAAIDLAMAATPEKMWIGGVDMPTSAQTEATYLSTLSAAWTAVATRHGAVCAGAVRQISSVSSRNYAIPITHLIGSFIGSVSEEIDIAWILLGALVGANLRDLNGNPVTTGVLLHDETLNPGLDDARFTVLRTWAGRNGVYVNNPNIMSSAGSDIQYIQHRRVLNLLKRTMRQYLEERLSSPINVDATTGFILESDALEIEAGGNERARAVLMAKPKASGGSFNNGAGFLKLSRLDNILSTKTITCQTGCVPLAYPKAIIETIGYTNPALQVNPVSGV